MMENTQNLEFRKYFDFQAVGKFFNLFQSQLPCLPSIITIFQCEEKKNFPPCMNNPFLQMRKIDFLKRKVIFPTYRVINSKATCTSPNSQHPPGLKAVREQRRCQGVQNLGRALLIGWQRGPPWDNHLGAES